MIYINDYESPLGNILPLWETSFLPVTNRD